MSKRKADDSQKRDSDDDSKKRDSHDETWKIDLHEESLKIDSDDESQRIDPQERLQNRRPADSVLRYSECGKFLWKRLKRRHMPEVMDILRGSLYPSESVCRVMNFGANVMAYTQILFLIKAMVKFGVSIVALEMWSNRVVGVGICILEGNRRGYQNFFFQQRQMPNIYPAYGAMLDFYIKLEEQINILGLYNVDMMMHLVYFATHPAYRRKGIGRGTLIAAYLLANKMRELRAGIVPLDIDNVLTPPRVDTISFLATTPESHSIALSLGWDVVYRQSFKEWTHNGKTYAEWLEDDNAYALCVCRKL